MLGMGREDIDVAERHILDARDGTDVVHQLSDTVATHSHPAEPVTRNYSQIRRCSFSHTSMAGSA